MTVFFKPTGAWAADFIPFYWEGVFHLFYLKDYRDRDVAGEGVSWAHAVTRDLVTFTELPDAISHGGIDDQDLFAYTGCVVAHEGTFHAFYTGHNPHHRGTGRPAQAILHAVSDDLVAWRTIPGELLPDTNLYERDDWRDPFVLWNDVEGEYWMLLAARLRDGPDNRRGVTALAKSSDLASWRLDAPMWAPGLYYTHECPDVFEMAGRWYLIYSEFTDRMVTRYRVGRSLNGPWEATADDTLDGRAWYAAKTASDGERRFAFGWLATREGERDSGDWQWGGQLVPHEVVVRSDGSLGVCAPKEILARFTEEQVLFLRPGSGSWGCDEGSITVDAGDGFAWCAIAPLADACVIETTVAFDQSVQEFGVLLRTDERLERYYRVRVDVGRQQLEFDRYRSHSYATADPLRLPYAMERRVRLDPRAPVSLRIVIDGSAFVVYADDQVALSARGYDYARGGAGLYISSGHATFKETRIRTYSREPARPVSSP